MTQNSVDYSDIFCQAVSNIVNNSIAQLEFDISRECTITKINDKAFGKYQVSDGSISFEAIASAGAYYEIGDRVMVTIPKGDYNKQISILTKIVDVWSGPAGFVRPLDTIIKCTDNIVIEESNAALIANGEVKAVEILRLTEQKFFGFQKMGVSADFKTLINGLNVIDGTYGLRFSLIELDPETNKEKQVQQFIFSNKDMLGNPYEFSTYFTQEYAFDIPENFSRIHEVIVEFYQDNNFINGNKQEIEVSKVNNLFVKNLKIYFGYDVNKTLGEIVEIHSDYLTYDSTTTKHIELSWFHKIDENTMQKIDQTSNKNIFGVRWYKYISGCAEANTDDYGGKNWFLLNPPLNENDLAGSLMSEYPFTTLEPIYIEEEFPFSLEAPVLDTKEKEQFKAVCLMKTYPLINDPTYEVIECWTSNTLTFDNTKEESDGGESAREVVQKDLSLVFSDNSYGNYFIYDQNGDLLDIKDMSKVRSVMLYYKGLEINEDNPLLDITDIVWSLPQKEKSMITYDKTSNELRGRHTKFDYKILKELDLNLGDNTIQCSVYVGGQLFTTLYETLRFGKQGSNGTTTTFILEMMDGKNAVVLGDDDGLRVQAILIKDTGKRIYFTDDEKSKIKWALLNNKYISQGESNSDIITLSCTDNESPIPSDHYTILKAVYQYEDDGPQLEAYLPIPIKKANCDYMIGATQILYNHQGIPKYNNGAYIAQSITQNGDEQVIVEYNDWHIQQEENNPNPVSLKQQQEDGKGISASPLFSKGSKKDRNENLLEIQDEVCIYCTHDNEIIWSQPILIMQSQYDFAMLNSWDGSLTIDEKNGTILSTMLGAGRKNDQNQFSGVLIGDMQGGTELEDTETMTGVYGFQNGIVTYGLKENGTAFFGAYNNGRIEIDGTSGVIKSTGWYKSENGGWVLNPLLGEAGHNANYPGATTGTVLDLSNGKLLIKGKNDNYFKFNANNDGQLQMKLSGVNIILTDQDNENLSTHIETTASGIISTVSSGLNYIGTCDDSTTTVAKNVKVDNFQSLVKGITLAVTFTQGNSNQAQFPRKLKINNGSSNNIVFRGADGTWKDGLYACAAGDVIFFVYDGSKWIVNDNGAYSKIQQNATNISAKVSNSKTGGTFSWNLTDSGFYLVNNGNTANANNSIFACNKDGLTINGNGTFTGTITANEGSIGGWTIGTNGIFKGETYSTAPAGMSATGGVLFWGGYSKTNGKDTYKFKVDNSGILEATGATITGNITATEGTIGGWTIGTNSLSTGTFGAENGIMFTTTKTSNKTIGGMSTDNWRLTIGNNFGVTGKGNVYCNNLYAVNGSFTGDVNGATWDGHTLTADYISFSKVVLNPLSIYEVNGNLTIKSTSGGTLVGYLLGLGYDVTTSGRHVVGWY